MPEVIWPNKYYPVRVFVGGCVKRGDGSSFRRKAHAHCYKRDPNFGCICVRSRKRLGIIIEGEQGTIIVKPSMFMLHELAHILSRQGHTKRFYETVRAIGGAIDKADLRYQSARDAKKTPKAKIAALAQKLGALTQPGKENSNPADVMVG